MFTTDHKIILINKFIDYKSPLLQFLPNENKNLRKWEKVYEVRIKRVSRKVKEEFNSLFSKISIKKRFKTLQDLENNDSLSHINLSALSIEESFINTSKLLKAIDLIEGSSNAKKEIITSPRDHLNMLKVSTLKVPNKTISQI